MTYRMGKGGVSPGYPTRDAKWARKAECWSRERVPVSPDWACLGSPLIRLPVAADRELVGGRLPMSYRRSIPRTRSQYAEAISCFESAPCGLYQLSTRSHMVSTASAHRRGDGREGSPDRVR